MFLFVLSVLPGETLKGKIIFIAPKADESLNFPVKIEVSNTGGNTLKAGMYGTAEFEFPAESPAILIPRTAFVGSVSSNEIFVANNGRAELRKVVAGESWAIKLRLYRA